MRRILAGLAHALLVSAACGGGGGGGGGAPDTLAQGTITGMGSVAVTGTLFDTDMAVVEGIGGPGNPASLAIGMQVTVEGTRDGDTGTADLVTFDDDLEGPVSSVAVVEDGVVEEVTILGQTVVVEEPITLFEGIDFGDIEPGDVVEVSGLRDGDGVILATWVRLVTTPTSVSLEGLVESLAASSFMIGPIEVVYDETGVNTDLPGVPEGGLAEGDFVDVLGLLQGDDRVAADVVELEARGIGGSRGDAQVEGIVAEFANISDFEVGGQPVDASRFGVVFELDFLSASFDDGDRVEVEGQVQNGVLIARTVKLRAGEVRIEGAVGDPMAVVDLEAGTLELLDTATLEVDGATRYDLFAGLGDLAAGDFLEVRGLDLGDVVRPTEIRRVAGFGDAYLRGRVEAFDSGPGTFTIVGVEIATGVGTTYTNFPPGLDTQAEFYAFLSVCLGPLIEVTESSDDALDARSLDVADEIVLVDGCTP